MNRPVIRHYLVVVPAKRGYDWHCVCGSPNARGHNKTEEACEISHQRHLQAVMFRAKRGLK